MATYYVSTTGNDGDAGSVGSPWLTISYGVSQLHAGDTLYIRGGTYTGSSATIDSQRHVVNSGTSFANAVTISGFPGELVIMQPTSGLGGITLTAGASYIIIQDLTIHLSPTQTEGEGIYLDTAHHIRMQRLDLNGNGAEGFGV